MSLLDAVNETNITTTATPLASSGVAKDDAAWILTNAFLVLTMQSGFGLLEAGCVSSKNIANIMVKNVVDVCMGMCMPGCFVCFPFGVRDSKSC